MARFPWTQMVLFSELAPFGPLDQFALPPEMKRLRCFRLLHASTVFWLIPGSMFLKNPEDGRVYNTAVVINPEARSSAVTPKCSRSGLMNPASRRALNSGVFDVPEVGRFSGCRSAMTCGSPKPRAS